MIAFLICAVLASVAAVSWDFHETALAVWLLLSIVAIAVPSIALEVADRRDRRRRAQRRRVDSLARRRPAA